MTGRVQDEHAALRRRRMVTLAVVLAAAALVVGLAIAASRSGGEPAPTSAEARGLLAGIPQDGPWLGRLDAPVVVEEYADLQCPFCARAAREALPAFIAEHVRTGRARLRFRTLTFLDQNVGGTDSAEAGRAAVAAGLQDRLWGFVERFYARQGPEGSGFVTESFLREVARAVPGLDASRMLAQAGDPRVQRLLAEDRAAMERSGVEGTPAFLAGRRGGPLRPVSEPTAEGLGEAVDRLVGDRAGR